MRMTLPGDSTASCSSAGTSAFALPEAFSFGSAPRNSVRGPGFANVDVALAKTWQIGAGSDSLCKVWRDASFDASRPAVYYLRVLEIPTPRFTTYDAVRNNLPLLEDVPATIQERAWSSPIWYAPGK